jgi:hypothetical protein
MRRPTEQDVPKDEPSPISMPLLLRRVEEELRREAARKLDPSRHFEPGQFLTTQAPIAKSMASMCEARRALIRLLDAGGGCGVSYSRGGRPRMHKGPSKERGWAYTELQPGVQNGR